MVRWQVDAGFVVDADQLAPAREGRDEVVRVLDHKVAVERQFGDLAQGLYDGEDKRDVGTKCPSITST